MSATTQQTTGRMRLRLVSIAAIGFGLSAGFGCDRPPDELGDAIAKASVMIQSLSPSGAGASPAEMRERTYDQVISLLQSKAQDGDAESQASAALIIADAHAGKAQIAAARARQAEGRLVLAMSGVQNLLETFLEQEARAGALSKYNAASDVASIEEQIAGRNLYITELQERLVEVEAEVADLAEKSARRKRSVAQLQELEAGLRQRAMEADVRERAELITEANVYRRQADTIEAEASIIDAQIARLAPMIDETRHELALVQGQIETLMAARDRAEATEQRWRSQATAARGEAQQTARQLADRLAGARAVLDNDVLAMYASAVSELESSESRRSRARTNATRDAAKAAEADAAHTLATVLRDRAQVQDRFAALLARLGSAQPALPESRAYQTQSRGLLDAAASDRAAAGIAIERARSALDGVRVSGESQARLDRLKQRLAEIEAQLKGVEMSDPVEGDTEGEFPPSFDE